MREAAPTPQASVEDGLQWLASWVSTNYSGMGKTVEDVLPGVWCVMCDVCVCVCVCVCGGGVVVCVCVYDVNSMACARRLRTSYPGCVCVCVSGVCGGGVCEGWLWV